MAEHSFDREFVGLPSPVGFPQAAHGAHPLQGFYYTPRGRRPSVAFIAVHYNVDFSEHYLGPYLAARGFGFLGWNTRFRGNEMYFVLDHAVAEVGAGVRWLRQQAGVECVVLLGNSGGGSLLPTYQAQATDHSLEPTPGGRLTPAAFDLDPGDLLVTLTAHPGRPDLNASCIDPSVTEESDPLSRDPGLDMYHPDNKPPYSPAFQRRYRQAQLERNRRISQWALAELDRIRANGGKTRDRLFVVPRLWADLRFLDPEIEPSNRTVNQCWLGDPERANASVLGIGTVNTLRTWLSMWSIDHAQCRLSIQGPHVRIPSLVIHGTRDTGVFESDAQAIFDSLAAEDKTLVVADTDHYLEQPEGFRDEAADMIADWVRERC
jgi:pimeloyl-ACP methyl ester carboxylesterase